MILVELCAGTASVSLWAMGRCRPLVGFMGSKRRDASRLCEILEVDESPPDRVVLVDGGPWGESGRMEGALGMVLGPPIEDLPRDVADLEDAMNDIPQADRPLEWSAEDRRIGPKPSGVAISTHNRKIGRGRDHRGMSPESRVIGRSIVPEIVEVCDGDHRAPQCSDPECWRSR